MDKERPTSIEWPRGTLELGLGITVWDMLNPMVEEHVGKCWRGHQVLHDIQETFYERSKIGAVLTANSCVFFKQNEKPQVVLIAALHMEDNSFLVATKRKSDRSNKIWRKVLVSPQNVSLCFAPIAAVLVVIIALFQYCSQTGFKFFKGSIVPNYQCPGGVLFHLLGINFCHTKILCFW